jgi:hypothetical protein
MTSAASSSQVSTANVSAAPCSRSRTRCSCQIKPSRCVTARVSARAAERTSSSSGRIRGDGFLAMFDGTQRAIRCALAIRDAVQSLGIEVRAGLHTGECEVRGDDIGGIAVHIGARVGALARPNDVLVSSTLRDLVDRVRARVRRPRHSPAQGCARRVAPLRRRVSVAVGQADTGTDGIAWRDREGAARALNVAATVLGY